ncbi:hypothetical protein RHCRD62_10395 [Rhodococcus sp. RD6.2]|nr:hypothetical protein RHCRD62_10395 [Rhodococcus sp. RD6.2]
MRCRAATCSWWRAGVAPCVAFLARRRLWNRGGRCDDIKESVADVVVLRLSVSVLAARFAVRHRLR